MTREIKKIDLCENCFERKSEYSYFEVENRFFESKIYSALLCKRCIKKLRGELK